MGLKCGIVGLPNVGKSTLFNAISNAKAESGNFPFCTIEPNVGVVNVPDERLETIGQIVQPQKVTPTYIEFVDIAGLVKGANEGEGLGNQFLANIREVDAIVHLVRCFEDGNVAHVDGRVDPVTDKEVIDTELQLKDLETVDKRLDKVRRTAKSGDKEAQQEATVLERLKEQLEQGRNIRELEFSDSESRIVYELQLLSVKPVIYVANVQEDDLGSGNQYVEKLRDAIHHEGAELIVLCANIEAQIAEIEDPDERQLFLEEYNIEESGLARLIKTCYNVLNLITYYTAGESEVRAWTIEDGWTAPQAAGVIHTDFQKGFIKAEVIKYDNFVELQSENACREKGKVGLEGKNYVVKDGDIMNFRFNV